MMELGKKIRPFRRKLIQIAAFGFCNPHIANFKNGSIYTGKWKNFCSPGLNCYSCPAAALSCPIGALQSVSGSVKFDFSFYIVGFLLAIGAVFGRIVCGFLCPFGLIQELLHKIPSRKFKLPKPFKYFKYLILIVFVLILPISSADVTGTGDPAFCEYICPAGTLEGGLPLILAHSELTEVLGNLFILKLSILIGIVVGSVFIMRFFCKTLCPLGAIYGLLNKISLYKVSVDKIKCVSCGKCSSVCPMDVDPVKNPLSAECIKCGKCADSCCAGAIKLSFLNTVGEESRVKS